MRIGIDDINLSVGHRYIDFELLVDAGRQSRDALARTGFRRRSVLENWQDPVTLAAEAAMPLIEDPGKIGLLLVGTETGLDYGKPISSYVHCVLGLGERCRNAEIKHACYGQTMALRLACAWVREHIGRQALVIGTDIGRPQGGVGELVAGAGAVAMRVTAEPRVLEVEPISGCSAQETYDVARPTPRLEYCDGNLSLCAYLDAAESAWSDLSDGAQVRWGDLDYVLYHCPSIPVVRRVHGILAGAHGDFERRVEPSLILNRDTANVYSASLYISLLGLLETSDVRPGARVGFFSYGSGACAEFWIGRIGPEPKYMTRHAPRAQLEARSPCSVEQWLEMDQLVARQLRAPRFRAKGSPRPGTLALERTVGWHRTYRWH